MISKKSFLVCAWGLLLQCTFVVRAQTTFVANAGTAAAPAQWNLASSWSCGGCGKYPGQSASNDIVIIDSDHGIYLGTAAINITVGSITIDNGTLIVRSTSTLNSGSVSISSSGTSVADFSIFATASGSPTVNISGDLTINRNSTSEAGASAHTRFRVGGSSSFATNSTVTITGNLYYNYNSASNVTVESSSEISVGGSTAFTDNCNLTISGDVFLKYNFNSSINNNVLSLEVGGSSSASFKNLNMQITESGSGVGSDIRVATKGSSNSLIHVTGNANMTWDDSTSPNTTSDIYIKAGNDASSAATSITIDGDLNMVSNYSTGSVNNWIRVSGSSTFKLGGALNFTASSASTKAQENQIELYDASNFEIKGAINNTSNGSFDFEPAGSADNSTITFSGSVAQNFPTNFPTTAGSYYKNLVINNSSGIPLTVPTITRGISSPTSVTDINIKSSIQLLNGIIQGSSSSAVILEDGATTTTGNSSSFVDGMVKKKGGAINNGLTLPLGAGSKWAPISLANITGADATTLMGFQYFSSGNSVTAVDASLTGVSPFEYWNTTVSGTIPQVSMTFNWENACQSNITDVSTGPGQILCMGVLGSVWSKTSSTINSGSAACDNSTSAAEVGSITIVTNNFSPYTFGNISGALAIKLLSFRGLEIDNKVQLKWTTAEENNVDYFVIEHSTDGHAFEVIGSQKPMGNDLSKTENTYTIDHLFPSSGLNYYRLVELETSGNKIIHQVIAVNFGGFSYQYLVYPNPVQKEEGLNVWIKDVTGNVKMQFYNVDDTSEEVQVTVGTNKIKLDGFRNGVYVYRLTTPNGLFTGKLVIK